MHGTICGAVLSVVNHLGSRIANSIRQLCVREESTLPKCLRAQEISVFDILAYRS